MLHISLYTWETEKRLKIEEHDRLYSHIGQEDDEDHVPTHGNDNDETLGQNSTLSTEIISHICDGSMHQCFTLSWHLNLIV